jgi:hypothetical protein
MNLKTIIEKPKIPSRIFAELTLCSADILAFVAICIARQLLEFSNLTSILQNILVQFGAKTKTADLALCKSRLTNLSAHLRPTTQVETDPRYWQYKADAAIIRAYINLYYVVKKEDSYKTNFQQFMRWACQAYGFAESARQMERIKKQQYDTGDGPKLAKKQQYDTNRAYLASQAAERLALSEFLRELKERVKSDD